MIELLDVRPPNGGEYFYCDENTGGYVRSDNAACFACGVKIDYPQCRHFNVIAQCASAARRIAAMFPRNACQEGSETGRGGVLISVWVCEGHQHNLNLLRELTSDGIITIERVLAAARAAISREKFNELVAQEAHSIWGFKEYDRSRHNWWDAWELCIKELGRIPTPTERRARAEWLHEERKWGQAAEDWLEAEKRITKKYSIAD